MTRLRWASVVLAPLVLLTQVGVDGGCEGRSVEPGKTPGPVAGDPGPHKPRETLKILVLTDAPRVHISVSHDGDVTPRGYSGVFRGNGEPHVREFTFDPQKRMLIRVVAGVDFARGREFYVQCSITRGTRKPAVDLGRSVVRAPTDRDIECTYVHKPYDS